MKSTTKTVEQLKAEMAAAQEAFEQAERAAREAERAEKQRKENEERMRQTAIIQEKMDAAFFPVTATFKELIVKRERFSLMLRNNVEVKIYREEARQSRYSIRTHYTGRYIVEVANAYCYGADRCASRYPSKAKDSTFNLPKMLAKAQELISREDNAKAAEEAKLTAKQAAEALAKELNERFNTKLCSGTYMSRSGDRGYSEYAAPAGRVYIGSRSYNAAQVEVYVRMMREIDALETK